MLFGRLIGYDKKGHAMVREMHMRFNPEKIRGVASELRRRRASRLDLIVPSSELKVEPDGRVGLSVSGELYKVGDRYSTTYQQAEAYLDELLQEDPDRRGDLKIEKSSKTDISLELNSKAVGQLLTRLEVPVRWGRKFVAKEPDLIYQLVTGLLERDKRDVLIRAMDGQVRAVLSSSYKPLDSADLFFLLGDAIVKAGGELWDARLFDDGFQLLGAAADMVERVQVDRNFYRDSSPAGDEYFPLYSHSNDDAGGGSAISNYGVVRKACANGLLLSDPLFTLRHSGADLSKAMGKLMILSADTLKKRVELDLAIVRDSVAAVFDPERFKLILAELQSSVDDKLPEGPKAARLAVQAAIGFCGLPRNLEDSILDAMLGSADASRYGLIQSLTYQSHALSDASPGLAKDFESAGGKLLKAGDYTKWEAAGIKAYEAMSAGVEEEVLVEA